MRVSRHERVEFACRRVEFLHSRQNLQRRYQAVARRRVVAENYMPRLFAAESVIVRAHILQNVPVAYRRYFAVQAEFVQSLTEADIRHDGCHDSFLGQRADFKHQLRADNHDMVAVDNVAAFVNAKATVSVAVVRNANVCVIPKHRQAQIFHVR